MTVPFKLRPWTATLDVDVHTPGDGTPCDTCDPVTAARRAPDPAWWDQQATYARRRLDAAQARVDNHQERDGLTLADNNRRRRDANVNRDIERGKRHRADLREIDAARARIRWIEQHRPS